MAHSPSTIAAATGVTILGIATGLQYEVLLAGFFGGLVSLSFFPELTWGKRFSSLVSSTMTAGYVAPVLIAVLAKWLDMDKIPMAGSAFAGFVIGLAAQTAIPVFFSWIKKRGDALPGA